MEMPSVAIIGAGRLAWSLIPNLQGAGILVTTLISRSSDTLHRFQHAYGLANIHTTLPDTLSESVIVITAGDSQIEVLAQNPVLRGKILLHTSGSIPLAALEKAGVDIGVLYPLQIFTFDKVVALQTTPILWEGQGRGAEIAAALAGILSQQSFPLSSDERLRVHAGAVFACNFTNYLYRIAANILPDTIPFSIYQALITEQTQKAFDFSPEQTQTGPALRGDKITMEKHKAMLETHPQWLELYEKISTLINPNI